MTHRKAFDGTRLPLRLTSVDLYTLRAFLLCVTLDQDRPHWTVSQGFHESMKHGSVDLVRCPSHLKYTGFPYAIGFTVRSPRSAGKYPMKSKDEVTERLKLCLTDVV